MINFIAICFLLGYMFGTGAVVAYILAKVLGAIIVAGASK